MNMYVDKLHSRYVCVNDKHNISVKDKFATIVMVVLLPHVLIVKVVLIFKEI